MKRFVPSIKCKVEKLPWKKEMLGRGETSKIIFSPILQSRLFAYYVSVEEDGVPQQAGSAVFL